VNGLFHIAHGEPRRLPAILSMFMLLSLAFLFISAHWLLTVGDPVQPNDNGAGDASVPPAQQYEISNVPPATQQADRDFLMQVEARDAKPPFSPSDSPSVADTQQSPAQPAGQPTSSFDSASVQRKTPEESHPSGKVKTAISNSNSGLASLALTGHTTVNETSPLSGKSSTVLDAQAEAVRRYPDLGVAGTRMNAAFIARYRYYRSVDPDYLSDPRWPLRLADEISLTLFGTTSDTPHSAGVPQTPGADDDPAAAITR